MATEFRRMQHLRGTTADWALNDIVLLLGEIGLEDTGTYFRGKVGTGAAAWSALPYSFEVDATARGLIAALELVSADHETRIGNLEALPAIVADNTSRLDALTLDVGNVQAVIPAAANVGDVVVWSGTDWQPTALTLLAGSLVFWNGTNYVALPQGTGGQVLTWDAGVPRWMTPGVAGGVATIAAATLTLDATHVAQHLLFTNAAGCVVTVPTNATAALPVGTVIRAEQRTAAGAVSFVGAGGVLLRRRASRLLETEEQYAVAVLTKTAADEWNVTGDLNPV